MVRRGTIRAYAPLFTFTFTFSALSNLEVALGDDLWGGGGGGGAGTGAVVGCAGGERKKADGAFRPLHREFSGVMEVRTGWQQRQPGPLAATATCNSGVMQGLSRRGLLAVRTSPQVRLTSAGAACGLPGQDSPFLPECQRMYGSLYTLTPGSLYTLTPARARCG